jgi:hypothetical protein
VVIAGPTVGPNQRWPLAENRVVGAGWAPIGVTVHPLPSVAFTSASASERFSDMRFSVPSFGDGVQMLAPVNENPDLISGRGEMCVRVPGADDGCRRSGGESCNRTPA